VVKAAVTARPVGVVGEQRTTKVVGEGIGIFWGEWANFNVHDASSFKLKRGKIFMHSGSLFDVFLTALV
jgi:hypothetical protein